MRAVLDPNILISALLSPEGTPARLLVAWQHGEFELVVSPKVLAELDRSLGYPKLRKRITTEEAESFAGWLTGEAMLADDPTDPLPLRSVDPGDDYLIALAAPQEAMLVSDGDHLMSLAEFLPICSARNFLERPTEG